MSVHVARKAAISTTNRPPRAVCDSSNKKKNDRPTIPSSIQSSCRILTMTTSPTKCFVIRGTRDTRTCPTTRCSTRSCFGDVRRVDDLFGDLRLDFLGNFSNLPPSLLRNFFTAPTPMLELRDYEDLPRNVDGPAEKSASTLTKAHCSKERKKPE